MGEVLFVGVDFVEYGHNASTTTFKLSKLLVEAGARVYVTSVTTDEAEVEKEKGVAEDLTNQHKV